MRISPAGLLVVLAVMVPILVELRTVAAYFGIDLSPVATVGIGLAVIATIVLWAVVPDFAGNGTEKAEVKGSEDATPALERGGTDPACEPDGGTER